MSGLKGKMYAVAVRDGGDLRLLSSIRRSIDGDVYFLIPRSKVNWKLHASYHKSGEFHIRSGRSKLLPTKQRPPDASFRGTEGVFASAIQPGELPLYRTPFNVAEFDDVFEISISDFPSYEHHTLSVDLVEPGNGPTTGPWKKLVHQKCFQDTVPWILVSFWRGIGLGENEEPRK